MIQQLVIKRADLVPVVALVYPGSISWAVSTSTRDGFGQYNWKTGGTEKNIQGLPDKNSNFLRIFIFDSMRCYSQDPKLPEEEVVALLSLFLSVICNELLGWANSLFACLCFTESGSLLLVNTVFNESLEWVVGWWAIVLDFLLFPNRPEIIKNK